MPLSTTLGASSDVSQNATKLINIGTLPLLFITILNRNIKHNGVESQSIQVTENLWGGGAELLYIIRHLCQPK